MDDYDWQDLLAQIHEGKVVPIVGSRLLLDRDGSSSIYAAVARRLLADYKGIDDSPLPAFRELNEAVMRVKRLLKSLGNERDFHRRVYSQICTALKSLQADGDFIPKPLQDLARITDFRLMVTVTPDDLLARALATAGRRPNEVIHSRKKPTADLPDNWDDADGPVQLLYLFGKASEWQAYAIHDEDVLEDAHNLISRGSGVPSRFLDELRGRNLLLIGCNFPDWLSRFILRAARNVRLADARSDKTSEWLVDSLGTADPFIGFLGQNSPGTETLTDVDPAQFVAELYQRWSEEVRPAGRSEVAAAGNMARAPQSAMFFISYSRATDRDRSCARKLKDALTKLGVEEHEIWFDTTTLKPGEVFPQRITDGIGKCTYFLPLVSREATQRDEAYVFREWKKATERLDDINTEIRTFLVPLVVDATNQPASYEEASVKKWCGSGINFAHAPEGEPDDATRKHLSTLIKKARMPGGQP